MYKTDRRLIKFEERIDRLKNDLKIYTKDLQSKCLHKYCIRKKYEHFEYFSSRSEHYLCIHCLVEDTTGYSTPSGPLQNSKVIASIDANDYWSLKHADNMQAFLDKRFN